MNTLCVFRIFISVKLKCYLLILLKDYLYFLYITQIYVYCYLLALKYLLQLENVLYQSRAFIYLLSNI